MRLCILLAFLAVIQLASSGPHAVPDSASAAPPVVDVASNQVSTDNCKNASSPGSQKCSSNTVTHEKTVITIEKTVKTETKNSECCSGDSCERCPKGTSPPPEPTPEPQTSTTTEAPTVPGTFTTTTTTPEPQTTPTTQSPTVPATVPTTTPEHEKTAATQRPTVPATLPTTTQKPPEPQPPKGPCNPDNCKPPNCTCISTKPPGGLDVKDMPQFVMLSFDDAVTSENMPFYRELLDPRRKNMAGGCGVAATFFASAEYTDYPLVNELYTSGSEIALHSISHKTDPDYWNGLNTTQWEREVVDQRRMMEKYANVPAADIRGFHGPFFFSGGDHGFRMLHRHFGYDCTLIHLRTDPADRPVYPYTLDFGSQKECVVQNCPQDVYPGLWSMPVNTMLRGREMGGGADDYTQCAMADGCLPQPETSDDTFEYLRANFENFYNTNRAPMPVFVHEAWLKDLGRRAGYLRFVDWLLEKEDVHLVTVSEVLDFMRNPRPKSSYVQRHCPKSPSQSTCPQTKSCAYSAAPDGAEHYLSICGTACPKSYPWVGNPEGN